jgi:hypothetical protein
MRGIGISLGILLGSTYLSREFNVRRELFASGEQGYWLDPSDFSTMFQDSAGTTPVTAVGQNVGRILDKSGRGNHFIQSSLASRPVLGRNPITGTRNLLTRTEEFDNTAWAKFNCSISANAVVAPDGTLTADKFIAASGSFSPDVRLNSGLPVINGATYTWSVYVQRGEYRYVSLFELSSGTGAGLLVFDLQTGTVSGTANGASLSQGVITNVGSGWFRISYTFAMTSTSAQPRVIISGSGTAITNVTGNGSDGIFIWGAQLELGSTATPYQRVTTAFDVTEAGVPDAYYLSYDGSDDFLVSAATINPGAVDNISLFAGLRKLSDTARGTVIEHTASVAANNGGFQLTAPNEAAGATYAFESKGTALTDAIASGFTAPITNVVTGLADISDDSNIIRVNGVQADSDTGDQGTGNFANALHYIGRRGGTSLPFNGRIYQLVTRFGPNLAADVITQSEAFVAQKTGFYRPSITGVPTIS